MLEEVGKISREWEGTGRPHIAIGVGIHTGEATCGVVGGPGRLEYTVIGDTVNLSARLESTTKEAGVSLLVSDSTASLLGGGHFLFPIANGPFHRGGIDGSQAAYIDLGARDAQLLARQLHGGSANR